MTPFSRFAGLVGAAVLCAVGLAGCAGGGGNMVGTLQGENRTAASYLAEIRSSNGLPGLSADAGLESAALKQARYMAGTGRMAHTTRPGRSFDRRMKGDGIAVAAENIAYGAFGPDELFRRWMNSPSHRRNMLDPDYTRYGLASAGDGNGRRYWALVLAQ